MTKQEFGSYDHSNNEVLLQSASLSGEVLAYLADYKIRDLCEVLTRTGMDAILDLKFMDFGCGVAMSMPHVCRHFARSELLRADVSQDSLEHASLFYSELVSFLLHEGNKWLVSGCGQIMLGGMMVFVHNLYSPLTVRLVNDCRERRADTRSCLGAALQGCGLQGCESSIPHVLPSFSDGLSIRRRPTIVVAVGGRNYV